MNLITGKKSEDHITSAQFRRIIEALTGGGNSYCPTVRNGLTPTVSGNSISVANGSIIHHGCVFECDAGSDDTVTFGAGTSGTKRIDLVCCKYTRNNSTGIETAVWEVLQGTAVSSSSTPVAPTVPSGDLRDADATQDYCPVFKLIFDGTSVTCEALLDSMPVIDKVTTQSSTSVALSNRHTVVVSGQPTALSVSFTTPTSGEDYETSLIFKAGASFALTETAPTGYAIHWEYEPDFTSGNIYEIIYRCLWLADSSSNVIIDARYGEVS